MYLIICFSSTAFSFLSLVYANILHRNFFRFTPPPPPGTLTANQMDFMKCSIAGKSYGTGLTEIAVAAAKRTVGGGGGINQKRISGYNIDVDIFQVLRVIAKLYWGLPYRDKSLGRSRSRIFTKRASTSQVWAEESNFLLACTYTQTNM